MSYKVKLFALSTCIHCRNLKRLLNENHVQYKAYDVDLAGGPERQELIEDVKKYHPDISFPTLIVDGKVFVGFVEKPIRAALGL
jgi:glutaredoxin-like protein NrdH